MNFPSDLSQKRLSSNSRIGGSMKKNYQNPEVYVMYKSFNVVMNVLQLRFSSLHIPEKGNKQPKKHERFCETNEPCPGQSKLPPFPNRRRQWEVYCNLLLGKTKPMYSKPPLDAPEDKIFNSLADKVMPDSIVAYSTHRSDGEGRGIGGYPQ